MKTRPGHRAFTLVEILVAVALIGIVVSVVLGSMAATTRSVEAYRARVSVVMRSQIGLQKIAASIRCCCGGLSTTNGQVRWITTQPLLDGAAGQQGPFDVTLRWDSAGARLLARQNPWRPGSRTGVEAGPWEILADHVRGILWSFSDGTAWRPDWEGDVNKPLPRLVRIDLTAQDDKERVYELQALAMPGRTIRAAVGPGGDRAAKP
jgi:prepilin-type N-terminal cleavage/methylation domain-containing protein